MKCPKCNFENPDSAKFCQECGAFIIKEWVKEEFRFLTLLFADISGFTKLSHSLDPEEVQLVLNTCFEHFNPIIVKYGGSIHKYEGDLVIAVFGLPISYEDSPERAIKASLEMIKQVPLIKKSLSLKLKMEIDIGLHIGINSGFVAVGEIGSKEKKEYTIMGDTVNIASRLKDIAKDCEIIVSDSVFRSTRYLFEYDVLPPVLLKGIDKKFPVFMPKAIKEKPDKKRGIQGLYSPMIGRNDELNTILGWLKFLASGNFSSIFILGEPGIGKSRLLYELKELINKSNLKLDILESRCTSYNSTTPLFPFLEILRKIFNIYENDNHEIIKEKLINTIQDLFPDDYENILPYLGYLFSIYFSEKLDEKIKYLGPKALNLNIFSSIKKLLERLSLEKPLILSIDDFHWIDTSSMELLQFIFDSQNEFPLMLLVLSRIESSIYKFRENLRKKLNEKYIEIVLKPFNKITSIEFIQNLLKAYDLSDDLKNLIIEKTEGNPFYIEEIIRTLIDDGFLKFENGKWLMETEFTSSLNIKIPDSIHSIISSRIDKLPPETREILQTASVIGRSFYLNILQNISDLEEIMLILHLATLEEFEFIRKVKSEKDLKYIFIHPLVQEVAYNSMLKKKRKELHTKTGMAIEKIYSERLYEFTELLAFQYENSNNIQKAIEWLLKAGKKAQKTFANNEAIKYFEKVIQIVKENPDFNNLKYVLIEVYEALGEIYSLLAQYPKAQEYYNEIINITEDKKIKVKAMTKIAEIYQNIGKVDDSLKLLEYAQKNLISDSPEDNLELAEIHFLKSWVYRIKGEFDRGIKEGEIGLKIFENLDSDSKTKKIIKAKGYNNIGLIFWKKGDYAKAIEFLNNCLEIFKEAGDKQGIGRTYNNLGIVYRAKGEYDKAIEIYNECLKIFVEIGDERGIGSVSNNLGSVYKSKEEYENAIEFFNRSLKISEKIGAKHLTSDAYSNLGMIYKIKGDYEKAIEFFNKDLKICEEIEDKCGIAVAMTCLGEALFEMGKIDESYEYLSKAQEKLEELGDKSAMIENLCSLSKLEIRKFEEEKEKESLIMAYKYVEIALKYAEEIGSISQKADCYFIFGKILSNSENPVDIEEAKEYFNKAIMIYEQLGKKYSLAECYLEYGKLLQEKYNNKEFLIKALNIFNVLKIDKKTEEVKKLLGI